MSNSYGFGGNEEFKEESSWRYPLAIFFATLILCAIFLYHYVGPGVDELQGASPKPTISDEKITLVIADRTFKIEANYTVYPRDRNNGEREKVYLYALWPTMNGYAPPRRDDFVNNAADTRRVDMVIDTRDMQNFSEQRRLDMLYLPHVIDKRGIKGDYELTRYVFKEGRPNAPSSGYADKELYVGRDTDEQTAVLFCYKVQESSVVPPDCWREVEISPRIGLKYYFKRPYLPDWKQIDRDIRAFVSERMVTG